jgi:hypothetical protein
MSLQLARDTYADLATPRRARSVRRPTLTMRERVSELTMTRQKQAVQMFLASHGRVPTSGEYRGMWNENMDAAKRLLKRVR